MSAECERHQNGRPVRAWLCVTDRFDPDFHEHVCGIHAKRFRDRSRFVFCAIGTRPAFIYPWLAGYGCTRDDDPATPQPPERARKGR